jgi:tryptophan halogenase
MNKQLHIVIIGGGTAGWFTAAAFSKFKAFKDVKITLIESPSIPRIGVGESVTPHIQAFFDALEVPKHHWMQNSGSTYKYANRFVDWGNDRPEHFGFTYTNDIKYLYKETEVTNQSQWKIDPSSYRNTDLFIRLLQDKKINKFDQYFNSQYHYMEKNVAPWDNDQYLLNPLLSWTQHINAEKCAEYMRDYIAIPNGTEHKQCLVKQVVKNGNCIDHLILENEEIINADLFVDASGWHKVLIKELGWEEKMYTQAPIDRAIVCQLDYNDPATEMTNYTETIGQPHGWQFRIGLYHRIGCGYCFSSSHVSDEKAMEQYLLTTNSNNKRFDPKIIKWTPKRLEKMADGNTVAIGLSCGFYEPMEANLLYIVVSSIRRLLLTFDNYQKTKVFDFSAFNDKMTYAIDDIADFIKVHYTLSPRTDTDFWNDMREIGRKENHKDILYQKYNDDRNTMMSAQDGWTLFPDYMWLQLATAWKVDISKWSNRTIDNVTYNLGLNYWKNLETKHHLISGSRENNYKWMKKNVFNNLLPQEWEEKYL